MATTARLGGGASVRAILLAAVVATTAVVAAQPTSYPFTVGNCGVESTYREPPRRAVTLNQGTTEIMLALGLEGSMAATAYLDDVIDMRWMLAYQTINTTFLRYPSSAQLEAVAPDFLYASYRSAFSTEYINYTTWDSLAGQECQEFTGNGGSFHSCRSILQPAAGVGTYLQEYACENDDVSSASNNITDLEQEIRTIATIFNVSARAESLILEINEDFKLAADLMRTVPNRRTLKALWLDSWDDSEPYVGACCGAPALIMREAGLDNIAGNMGIEDQASWVSMNWTDIVAADPDVIILVDASWDRAIDKVGKMCNVSHPASGLEAVRSHKMVTIPFSASTLGVKIGDAAVNLAVAALYENGLVNTTIVEPYFKTVEEIAAGYRQAQAASGVSLFLSLPPELHAVCPFTAPGFGLDGLLNSEANTASSSGSLSAGAIAGITVAAVVGVALAVCAALLAMRYHSLYRKYTEVLLADGGSHPHSSSNSLPGGQQSATKAVLVV